MKLRHRSVFEKVSLLVKMFCCAQTSNETFNEQNEHHLRRSLKTLINYAQSDEDMSNTTFPVQVRELSLNLHRILLDTVKMKEFKDVRSAMRLWKGFFTVSVD